MSLTKKEIDHFQSELPEGMKVIDLTGVKSYKDFVEKYCPEDFYKFDELPYSIKAMKAIDNFLKLNK